MKKKGKSGLAWIIMLCLVLSACLAGTGTVLAEEKASITVTDAVVNEAEGIHKLQFLFSVPDGSGLMSGNVVFSMDGNAVKPIKQRDYGDTTINSGTANADPFKIVGLVDDVEGTKYSIGGSKWYIDPDTNRYAVTYSIQTSTDVYVTKPQIMYEFYYKILDESAMAGTTFRFETDPDGIIAKLYGTPSERNAIAITSKKKVRYLWRNANAEGTLEALTGASGTMSYPGSDKLPALGGSVELSASGMEPVVAGMTLTATASKTEAPVASLTYTWLRGETVLSESSGVGRTTYQTTPEDAGAAIKVRISHSEYSGSPESNAMFVYGAPSQPTGLSVRQSNSGELTYSWKEPANNGGKEITNYILTVTAESGNAVAGSPFTLGGTELEKKVTGLTVGTTYKATIAARNEIETGTAASFEDKEAVNKVNAEEPNIDPDLSDATYAKEYGDELELTIGASVSDGGTLSYQWYEAADKTAEGTAIQGATTTSYKPEMTVVGTRYFYCVVTNRNDLKDIEEALRGETVVTKKSTVATVTMEAKAPGTLTLDLTAGNKKIDAKWNAAANGAEVTYTYKVTYAAAAVTTPATIYGYFDGTTNQAIQVTNSAINEMVFTSEGGLTNKWITIGGVSYPLTGTTTASSIVLQPARDEVAASGSTTSGAMSFTNLTNGTLYTVTVQANNAKGESPSGAVTKTATPKASSGGGGGGGGGGGSSSGTTTTGTDIKKEIPSSGSTSISTSELKGAKSIEAKNMQITVTMNQQAINVLDKTTGLIVKTEKKSSVTMNDTAKGFVGSRPVFDVTATQNGKAVTNFGTGKITISIAYTPASGENTGKLFLYTINDKGEAEKVSGSKYDATLKAVTGQTNHLSLYAVGYDEKAADTTKPATTFQDVSSSDWFYTAVMNLSDKGIVSGIPNEDAKGNPVGTYKFNPSKNVTRAEFASMLAKAAGADLSKYSTKVFGDVSVSDWYAGAVAWANTTGVASGTGDGNFRPTANITRQDMVVMISKYVANVAKKELEAKNEKNAFTDAEKIAGYAASAVEFMQTAGIISGLPNEDANGKAIGTYEFRPTANATRAEAAAMMNGLLSVL